MPRTGYLESLAPALETRGVRLNETAARADPNFIGVARYGSWRLRSQIFPVPARSARERRDDDQDGYNQQEAYQHDRNAAQGLSIFGTQ